MYLVGNGFKVIRYDHTNHVGISYGEHKGFKLSKMYEDFDSVFNYIKSGRFIYSSLGILGVSLASRVLIKYLSYVQPKDVELFISLVGVLNLDNTLSNLNVVDGDPVVSRLNGKSYGMRKILKQSINCDNFLDDAIEYGYCGIDSTKGELEKIITDMVVICAEKDDWVDKEDYFYIFNDEYEFAKEKYVLPDSKHQLNKNPEAAEQAIKQIIKSFAKYLKQEDVAEHVIYKPSFSEIVSRNKCERNQELYRIREMK